jgi:putative cardiolipin synthase
MKRTSVCRRAAALIAGLVAALVLAGCAIQPITPPPVRPPPQDALPPASGGPLAAMEAAIRAKHGPEVSGFELLDRNEDGLRWRLALIDSAQQSIDMQYYVWFADAVGGLLLKRVVEAADRGVKVRLLIDDLNSMLRTAASVQLRDEIFAMIDAHPNIQLRLFNPWKDRALASRVGEMAVDTGRLNQRMHIKAMVVDNRAAILGGRNLGDEYFGLSEDFNFHDLDVIGFGPVARQASAVVDMYWNSGWVLPASALNVKYEKADVRATGERILKFLAAQKSLERFPLAPQSWTAELDAIARRLHPGTSRVVADIPRDGQIEHVMSRTLYEVGGAARRELLIVNAYIIPDQQFVDVLGGLKGRGVDIRILTNSLASHDVPAVNSHYKQWRKPLREATGGLHEMRHDGAIQRGIVDTPPTRAQFMGLHSKGMVVDRKRVYIGSMNFDPRSAAVNTEAGVVITSLGLAGELAKVIERGMTPANSWRVDLGKDGTLVWSNDRETVVRQPARNTWQRVEDVIFMAFPKDLY